MPENRPQHSNRDNMRNRTQNSFAGSQNNRRPNHSQSEPQYTETGNLGLLYTRRYYDGLTSDMLILPSTNEREKKDIRKRQNIYYRFRNRNLIEQSKRTDMFNNLPLPPFNATFLLATSYPGLITGIGISHSSGHENEAKLGLAFDHTTGLPFIPGSSVKGLLRSVFPGPRKTDETERCNFIREKLGVPTLSNADIIRLGEIIFGSDNKDSQNHTQGCDIFHDAFPVEAISGLLDLDYITPHTKGEFSDPNPIQFMRIKPGVTFRFSFILHPTRLSDSATISPSDKEKLFKHILTTVGIGAKTNVGYGQLK